MTDLTPAKAKAALRAVNQAVARKSFIEFCKLTVPGFQSARHLLHIADLLARVERGELRKLVITTFPGSGKSTLLQAFSAWFIGRDPRRKIISASAGAELAERNSRAARALFAVDSWPFEAALSQDTRSMTRWDTTQGGGYFAASVGSLITGWRAPLLVAEDLQNSAGTQAERDGLWTWFREVLSPRLEPGGAQVVVTTRWSPDDLVARIEESADGNDWHVVRLPALAEEGDPLGRAVGESLWPERWPVGELLRQKVAMGSRAFECQFQANPVTAEGNLIKAEWLQYYDKVPPHFESVICAIDTAAKTGVANDFTAILKVGVTTSGYYLLDAWRAKVEFPALLRRVKAISTCIETRHHFPGHTLGSKASVVMGVPEKRRHGCGCQTVAVDGNHGRPRVTIQQMLTTVEK